jgi:DNA-binding MarR family transcriptional regulator
MTEIPLTGVVWQLSMRWRTAIGRAIAPLGLTAAQYAVLVPLLGLERDGRHPSQRELADFVGLEALYVSKLARSLEKAGFVARTGHPNDTRAVQLTLTDLGRDVATRAIQQVIALQASLTAPLGGPDSAQTRALSQSLQLLLHADLPDTPPLPLSSQISPQTGARP